MAAVMSSAEQKEETKRMKKDFYLAGDQTKVVLCQELNLFRLETLGKWNNSV